MSANIKVVNYQSIAASGFTWVGDLWYPTSADPFKVWLGNRFALTETWPVQFAVGDPGYSSYVNCFIRVRFWNTVGAQVWDSGKNPCWLKNGYTYEFDCVTKALTEVSGGGGTIVTKQLRYDSTLGNIPVSSVPLNSEGYLQITARNDGEAPALMRIDMTVSNPGGTAIHVVDYQSAYVYPGENWLCEDFYAISFSQSGTYTIQIWLLVWTGSAWVQVDQWSGNLCTVGAVPPSSVFSDLTVTYSKL